MNDPFSGRFYELFRAKVPAKSNARGNGRFAAATSLGLVRSHNEDRCALIKARFGGAPNRDFNLGIVCDGLGGMEGGEEAAVLGLGAFVSTLVRSTRPSALDRMAAAIVAANTRIYELLRGRGGTTLTAVLVTRHHGAYLCHVGDSRLFAIGPERLLHQLTRDDTLGALLQKPTPEPRRDSRLLQFVGMGDEMEPQLLPLDWRPVSSFLLTTDGAHDLPHGMLDRVVNAASSPLDLSRKLIQLSDMLGGIDNSSVVMLPANLEDEPARSASLELTVLLPADEVSIWLGSAQELAQPQHEAPQVGDRTAKRSGGTEAIDEAPKSAIARGEKTKKASGTKPRKVKTSRRKPSDTQLPLVDKAPAVNVEFPNEQQRGQG